MVFLYVNSVRDIPVREVTRQITVINCTVLRYVFMKVFKNFDNFCFLSFIRGVKFITRRIPDLGDKRHQAIKMLFF